MADPRNESTRRGAVRVDSQPSSKQSAQAAHALRRGAARHNVGFFAQLRSWLRHHQQTAGEAWQRLRQTPLPTLMTLAVLAIALALPALMFVGLKNVNQLSGDWRGEPRISLYLDKTLTEQQVEQYSQELLLRSDLIAVELVSKEQGLHEFQQISGFTEILSFVERNPLPAVIVVQPYQADKQMLQQLQQSLQQQPQVDQAVLDMLWVERLASFVELANRLVLVLGALLALSALLVIGNTIRLSIENRRDEIQVAKLVGATDAWVRRPFLYTGVWFGLLGAFIAWLLVQISMYLISPPVTQLALLYQSGFVLQGLGFTDSAVLLLAGLLIGVIGARLAVGRHLREIEPG